jgi:hypothetical protein
MYAHACKVGLEGVISKVRDSAYTSGRGNNWVKKTCAQRETLTIAGFAMKDRKFDGIFVGRQKGESRRLGLLPADDVADGNPVIRSRADGPATWRAAAMLRSGRKVG